MYNLNVYDGTPNLSQKTLCGSCRHSHIARGVRDKDELIRCTGAGLDAVLIRFPVAQCNDFETRHTPSVWEMKEIAWKITADPKVRTGFRVEQPKEED